MCEVNTDKPRPSIELADVLRRHADAYREQHGVSAAQHKVIHAIVNCRTAVLGGHVAQCDNCGIEEISYNSCRNRHCPKCQTTKKLRWLEKRKAELLPVDYFHVVFTLPHELNGIASYNSAIIYQLLFQAAWSTVNTLGQDPKRLGGTMGMQSFLHTWGQNLSQHIHLHCLIPAGALCENEGQMEWKDCRPEYLFPVKVMSKLFRKLFLKLLQEALNVQALRFQGSIAFLAEPKKWSKFLSQLQSKSWNVYAKTPFNGAEGGLEYLARYVNKTAISNDRILSCDDETVTFQWRDYSDENKLKIMRLPAHEFIRRFLSHVLPHGFMRIRSFGFLANPCKAKKIQSILQLLPHDKKESLKDASAKDNQVVSIVDLIKQSIGLDIELCKHCQKGHLRRYKTLLSVIKANHYLDSS